MKKTRDKTPDELHREMLEDFEASLVAQMARINERLSKMDTRVRRANMKTIDNGPLIVENGLGIACSGDEIDVRTKK